MAAIGIILLISTVLLAANYTVQTRMASINIANNISFGAKTDLRGENVRKKYKMARVSISCVGQCVFSWR